METSSSSPPYGTIALISTVSRFARAVVGVEMDLARAI
jgi:hypothetical protein